MTENDSVQKYIQQFIQENRNIYTNDAIIQKLIKAGYSRDDIDAAYASMDLGNKTKRVAQFKISQRHIGFLMMVIGFPLLGVLVFFLVTLPMDGHIYLLSQTSILLSFAVVFLAWIS